MKPKKPKEKKIKPVKEKRARKKLSLRSQNTLFDLICLSVYLGAAIPLWRNIEGFTLCWFLFWLIAVVVPLSFLSVYIDLILPQNPPAQKRENAKISIAIYTLLFWFYDLLYMAIFNQWLVWEYIFGLLAVIIIFVNLTKAFLSPNKVGKWLLPFDLLAGVGLSVYLIYRIPNPKLQTIVTTIVAAMFGGLLTLVGVAWTIRQGQKERAEDRKQLEEDRKQEEIKKAKPIFTFSMLFEKEHTVKSGEKICFPADMPDCRYKMNAVIENSDRAPFEMKRLFLDGKWYDIEGNTILLPSGTVILHIQFESYLDIFLEICDAMGNSYYYEMKVVSWKFELQAPHFHYTLREIKEITFKEMQNKIDDHNKQV